MNLAILISKKGTRVVKATALHRELGLTDHHYATNVRKWLQDVYQFRDSIRKPAGMTDYARAGKKGKDLVSDYYLSLELARLITLASKSKFKQPLANKLLREEQVYPERVQLAPQEMLQLVEQTKAMSRFSCQMAAAARHHSRYVRQRHNTDYWNQYRTDFIGYKKADLLLRLRGRGLKVSAARSFRELVFQYDPTELIRIGIIDHYAAQGFSLNYASQLGDLAKSMAKELRLEIFDDGRGDQLFATPVDADVMAKLQRGAAA